MTAKELHEACHEACCGCPQFSGYDDDQQFQDFGLFGEIPKKGMYAVVKFWQDNQLLWKGGYSALLPEDVRMLFKNIDNVIEKALKEYLE